MQIKIWSNFSKRVNSTKQPTGGTTVDVLLKDQCDVLAPSFILNTLDFNINYVQAFGNYYFAQVINLDGHRSEIKCTLDHLATFKSDIGAYTCYVERSAAGYTPEVFDPLIYPTGEIVQSEQTQGDILPNYNASGNYVVTCVGKNGLKQYMLSEGQVQALFNTFFDPILSNYLDTNNQFGTLDEAIQAVFIAICNPSQYIKSVTWFPFDLTSGLSETPYFGFVPGNATVNLATKGDAPGGTITLPSRYYNDYRDFDSRFTSATLYLPGAGVHQIDPKLLNKTLAYTYWVDSATGAGEVTVFADNSEILSMACQLGCNVPIGGLTGANLLSSLAQGFKNAVATGQPLAAASGITDAFTDFLSPPQASIGASGNRYCLADRNIQMTVTRLGSTAYPTATSGRATYKNYTISSLSGYIKCNNASVPISGDGAEQDVVNNYLNSGFYYE